jgi:hypothetical protein
MKVVIDKKALYVIFGFFIVLIMASALPHLKNGETEEATSSPDVKSTTTTVLEEGNESGITVEVYHFHATNQCWSCIRLGELAKKTLTTYYANELASGKLAFAHADAQKPENKDLVMKYGVRGSSLFIGTYMDGEFHSEEIIQVWY